MKKRIKINYKSIFKYPDHHETVQYKTNGHIETNGQKTKISFFQDHTKIEITINVNDVTLIHGSSMLNLSYHRTVFNHYLTPYGMIDLYTELITLQHDSSLRLKYILKDEKEIINEVYMMVNYEEI